MSRAIKIVIGIGVFLVALAVAGVAVLKSMDFNQYRGLIAEKTKEATGRTLSIAGDLKLQISLTPAIAVDGVTFANAPWGSRPEMLKLKHLAAEVQLIPLLSGDIRVNRIVLKGVDALIETDAKGKGNWEMGPPDAKPASGSGPLPIVEKVHVEDLTLTYKDGQTKTQQVVKLASLDLKAKGLGSPLDFTVKGSHNGAPFAAGGQLGPIETLVAGGKPYPIKLTATAFDAKVDVDGVIADPRTLKGLDLKIAAKAEDLAKTVAGVKPMVPALKDVKVPPLGPLDAKFRIAGTMPKIALGDIKISVGTAGQVFATVDGKIADVIAAKGFDLAIKVEAKDVQAFAAAAGQAVPRMPPLDVAARVQDSGQGYVVDPLSVRAGASDVSGNVNLLLKGKRPDAVVRLSSKTLDLKELLPPTKDTKPAAKTLSKDGRMFPADPLPLDALKAVDADISASVGRLVLPNGMAASDVQARVALKDGRLQIVPASFGIGGGRIDADVRLDGARTPAALSVKLDGKNVDWGQLLKQMDVTDAVADSKAEARVQLQGSGGSVRALMAGLNGEIRLVVGPGRLHNKALDQVGGDIGTQILGAVNPFVKKEEFTELKCGVVLFKVKDGMAVADRGIAAETGKVNVAGSGDVNLKTEEISFSVKPQAKEGLGINLSDSVASMVKITGTLNDPKVGLDALGAAQAAIGAGAAVATMGLSVVAKSLLEKTTGDANPCQTALGQKAPAGGTPAGRPAPAKKQDSGPADAVQGLGDSIGKGLKGLFGK